MGPRESDGRHQIVAGANVSLPSTVDGARVRPGPFWCVLQMTISGSMTLTGRTEWDSIITRYAFHAQLSSRGNRAVLGGDGINKQKPSRSGPSKVEVSGNSMCVVSRKPSVRLLLALAPHLAQPSALPLLPAPRLARCSAALPPGVRPPSLNSPGQWKGLEFKTR